MFGDSVVNFQFSAINFTSLAQKVPPSLLQNRLRYWESGQYGKAIYGTWGKLIGIDGADWWYSFLMDNY